MAAEKIKKGQISKKDFILMLSVAIFFDIIFGLIQIIPGVGSVAASVFNVIPLMLFFIWYRLLGVDFANPKKSISFFGASIIEIIPGVNILPAWTAEITYMYILQKKDVILAKAAGAVGGAAGATAAVGLAAKAVGSKETAEKLKETSNNLREKEINIRSRITPKEDIQIKKVGNEISGPKQQKTNEPDNIIQFPTQEKGSESKIAPFSRSETRENHNKDWIFPNKKSA